MSTDVLGRITAGRTDLVFNYIASGHAATSVDEGGVSLINWCAYYGDVSAIMVLDARAIIDAKDMNGDSPL